MKKEEKKKTLKELWQDKKSHAAIVLGLWGIFLGGVIIFMMIGDAFNPSKRVMPNSFTSSVEEFTDFSVMKEALLQDNYAYTYEVSKDNTNIIFRGKKLGNKEVGYQETATQTLKYEKDQDVTYQILLDQKIEITNLYDNIREDFLNSKNILNQISLLRKTETSNDYYRVYTYSANEGEIIYSISVTMDKKSITKIVIDHPTGLYTMKFTNIGEMTESNIYE